jgi:hypothetical protein
MKITFWDSVRQIGLEERDIITEYKAWFFWHSKSKPEKVIELLRDDRFAMLGKFRFYFDKILKATDKKSPIIEWDNFLRSLDSEIMSYRGGAGIFDPGIRERFPFVATTASYDVALMFAKFPDAKAVHLPTGPERKTYWVVETRLLLKDILGYRNLADEEVWINETHYKTARVKVQCKD